MLSFAYFQMTVSEDSEDQPNSLPHGPCYLPPLIIFTLQTVHDNGVGQASSVVSLFAWLIWNKQK